MSAVASERRPPYGDDAAREEKGGGLRLIHCHRCGRPIGRVRLERGSAVEIRCRSCGARHLEIGR